MFEKCGIFFIIGVSFMATTVSQNEKLIKFFQSGKDLTEATALSRFGVSNLSARIAELRAKGYSIYTNKRKEGVTTYRLGKPTRAMIAAAYATLGVEAFC